MFFIKDETWMKENTREDEVVQRVEEATAGPKGVGGNTHHFSLLQKVTLVLFIIALGAGSVAYHFRDSAFAATYINKYLDNQLESGLVGHWTFDGKDMTATTVVDKSGNGYTGTLAGSPVRTMGKIGQGLSYDAVDDLVTTPSMTLGANYSVAVWVNLRGDSPGAYTNVLLQAVAPYHQMYITNTTHYLSHYTDGTGSVYSNKAVPLNTWVHCAITVNGSTIKMYMDGELVSSSTVSGSASVTGGWNLGSWSSNKMNGSLDDVRIYNRALSQKEITRLYKIGEGTKINTTPTDKYTNGLVVYWTFDAGDMSGNTIYDRSPTHATGTFYNGVRPAIGRQGQGLDFAGAVGDFVDVSLLPTMTDYTYSVWLKTDSYSNGQTSDGSGTYFVDRQPSSNALASLKAIGGRFAHQYRSDGGTGLDAISGSAIQIGKWQHLVWGKNGTEFFIYVDGVKTSNTASLTVTPESPRIGSHQSLTGAFDGLLDDFRIYNRALSQDEITGLYNLGTPIKINTTPTTLVDDGLVGYWTFDGPRMNLSSSTAEVTDSSGYGNNGNWINHATTTTIGKIGQALWFDGVDDYVVSNLNKTLIGNTPTISMWIRPTGAQTLKGIFQVADSLGNGIPWILFQRTSSTSVRWYVNGDYRITQTIDDNAWYHLVLLYDGTTWRAYKNGVADGTYVGSIGSYFGTNTWFGNGFNGYTSISLDDVRIYNRALTANEVQLLYSAGR